MTDQENRHLGNFPWSPAELEFMTTKFVAAMAAAIRAGEERPPRVGIDPTPGTKKPRYVSIRARTDLQ
jgi:hypothetical protein